MQASDQKISPMMQQWHSCKKKAGSALLFFRMGDFYEAFYEDATEMARELDLTLTKRQEIPMCGVPVHTCEGYIDRLVAKGFRVAVAEQLEDPRQVKGLVKRDLTRVVTPGTVINSSLLSDKANNYIAALTRVGAFYGIAFLDLTTADFRVIEIEQEQELLNELYRFHPAELVVPSRLRQKQGALFEELQRSFECVVTEIEDWRFDHQITYDALVQHFKVHSLDGFGLKGLVAAINSAGALLNYIQDGLSLPTNHLQEIKGYTIHQFMAIDRTTQRHLELTESLHDGRRKNTLLGVIDETKTPMGARLLRQWLKQPLLSCTDIQARQEGIGAFLQGNCLDYLQELLGQVRDVERLIMRISSGYASPKDLVALRLSLEPLPALKAALQAFIPYAPLLRKVEEGIAPLPDLVELLTRSLADDPPARVSDGKIFRDGFHAELDELREISRDSKSWIARYQTEMRDQTGLKTLKVGYNKMFGYYIEVSRGQAEKMPPTFERRQTLVNAERFVTAELKTYESKVLTAEERMSALETELFNTLRGQTAQYSESIHRTAQNLAILDCLVSLARVARQNDYVRPIVDESSTLQIIGGRHPVIETALHGEKFVPNDTLLDDDLARMSLITGPNMAGKSTYIRQVALIAILAQMGSYVPAKSCQMGIIDKVFSRIGASDDLSRGQSTFMVEMTETAHILHQATSRSLVILDEIGRGTSTYDGISIAWSVAEYLLTTDGKLCKTLFATHYWELTKLEEKIPGALNYHVAVHESEDTIVFLRKIIRGGTEKSFGIHVGRLAGLPAPVISRAKEILVHLEENANRKSAFEPSKPKRLPQRKATETHQLKFF